MSKLTGEDRAVLRQVQITEAEFLAAREREEVEAERLRQEGARDGEGLSAADRAFLRRNPSISRERFIQTRRQEIEAARR